MIQLSIITISKNNYKGLLRTFFSLKDILNNRLDIEWLIVDGNSTDSTLNFLQNLNVDTSKCRWISESDNGIYHAMNKGINLSLGKYALFLNSGDMLRQDFELISFNTFSDINIFNIEVLDNNLNPVAWRQLKTTVNYLKKHPSIPHQSTFISKSFLNQSGGYDTAFKYLADYDFFCKAIYKYKAEVKFFPEIMPTTFVYDGVSSNFRKRLFLQREINKIQAYYFGKVDMSYCIANYLKYYISYIPFYQFFTSFLRIFLFENRK